MLRVVESVSVDSPAAAMSSLQQQIARAQEQIAEQRKTIANLSVQSFEAGAARMQLL